MLSLEFHGELHDLARNGLCPSPSRGPEVEVAVPLCGVAHHSAGKPELSVISLCRRPGLAQVHGPRSWLVRCPPQCLKLVEVKLLVWAYGCGGCAVSVTSLPGGVHQTPKRLPPLPSSVTMALGKIFGWWLDVVDRLVEVIHDLWLEMR